MVVGILQFELIVRGAESLKDKRRVVRSVKDRLHREHQVSVAEVASQDTLTLAVIGLAAVGTDGKRIADVLDRITAKLRSLPARSSTAPSSTLRPPPSPTSTPSPASSSSASTPMPTGASHDPPRRADGLHPP
jgi:uncharacterized protein